jgi:hypothetical protein
LPLRAVAMALILVVPQSGWALLQTPPREVGRVYRELVPETEIFVRLIPENLDGSPPLVSLGFQAFYPGRQERDPYSGLPRWPKGVPARLTVVAEPLPRTLIRELSLRLVIDGVTLDLTAPKSRYRNLPCLVATEDCSPNAVETELEPRILHSLISARTVQGQALGFQVRLTAADQTALAHFAASVGMTQKDGPRQQISPQGRGGLLDGRTTEEQRYKERASECWPLPLELWSGRKDLNLRPLGPEPSALPG